MESAPMQEQEQRSQGKEETDAEEDEEQQRMRGGDFGGKNEDDEDDEDDIVEEDDVTTNENVPVGGVFDRSVLLHGRIDLLVEKGRNLRKLRVPEILIRHSRCCGLPNPMVKMMVGNTNVVCTTAKKHTVNPNWRELFTINVCFDAKRLSLRVVDDEKFGESPLGHISFSTAQILLQGAGSSGVQGEFPLVRLKSEVEDLDTFAGAWAEDRKQKKIRRKSGKFGWLSFRLRFTPARLIIDKQLATFEAKKRNPRLKPQRLVEQFHPYTIPNVYFKAHRGDHFMLYQSTHQPGVGSLLPAIELDGGEAPFRARSCWKDLYNAISEAEQFICVCGFVIDPEVMLIRTGEMHRSKLTFGGLLLKKAREGLIVLVMIWDNPLTQKSIENCEDYFKGSSVHCVRVQRDDPHGALAQSQKGEHAYAHHEKCIIMDVKPADAAQLKIRHRRHKNAKVQAITSFLGGIDVAKGRYDDSDKSLFATIKRQHKEDFFQSSLPEEDLDAEVGPRQPWQDIHCRVTGQSAVDVLKTFIERWHKQVGHHRYPFRGFWRHKKNWFGNGLLMRRLMKLLKDSPGERALPQSFFHEAKDQIVGRTESILRLGGGDDNWRNNFGRNQQNIDEDEDDDDSKSQFSEEEFQDLQQEIAELEAETRQRAGSWNEAFSSNPLVNADKVIQIVRSIDEDSARLEKRITAPNVTFSQDVKVDNGLAKAYIHLIRQAKHFVYLEMESFIGSCFMWDEAKGAGAINLVPAEIAVKICSRIEEGKPFHVYLVLPLFPLGLPTDRTNVQALRYQFLTIQMIYKRIAEALKKANNTERTVLDYFSIFFLGNREADEQDKKKPENGIGTHDFEAKQKDPASLLDRQYRPEDYKKAAENVREQRRFPIFVHSKLLIVDDAVALASSGNINQRSLDGRRNTELGATMFEASLYATEEATPKGQIYGFRMSLWAEHLGPSIAEDPEFDASVLKSPASIECIHAVQARAIVNWDTYLKEEGEPENVPGHLMRYPYQVETETGLVKPLQGKESFPDFPNSIILGAKARITNSLVC